MKKPTDEQVKAEIATLREYLPRVRPETAWGESNTDAIEAQIQVLDELMDEDEIYDKFQDERIQSNALEARFWMDGQTKERPSKGWKPLLKPSHPQE